MFKKNSSFLITELLRLQTEKGNPINDLILDVFGVEHNFIKIPSFWLFNGGQGLSQTYFHAFFLFSFFLQILAG